MRKDNQKIQNTQYTIQEMENLSVIDNENIQDFFPDNRNHC